MAQFRPAFAGDLAEKRIGQYPLPLPVRGLFLAELPGFAAVFSLNLPLHLNTIEIFLHAYMRRRRCTMPTVAPGISTLTGDLFQAFGGSPTLLRFHAPEK